MRLLATQEEGDCAEDCALLITADDAGSRRGLLGYAIAGLAWNGPIVTLGGGVLYNPWELERLRPSAWAAIWF